MPRERFSYLGSLSWDNSPWMWAGAFHRLGGSWTDWKRENGLGNKHVCVHSLSILDSECDPLLHAPAALISLL